MILPGHKEKAIIRKYRFFILLFGFFLLLLLGVSFLLWHFQKQIQTTELEKNLDSAMATVMERIEDEKRLTLSMVLFLSQDVRLHQMLQNNDRPGANTLLQNYLSNIGSLTRQPIDIQVHTRELHTFLRSWDYKAYDIPLASFRKGLVKVKESHQPHVSVELGKRLNIKAIAPMMENDRFIGSIEVISGFESLRDELRAKGIILAILLHERYLEIATSIQDHPRIGKHLIANGDCHTDCLQSLSRVFQTSDIQEGAYLLDQYAIGVTPFFDSSGEQLGYWAVIISRMEASSASGWDSPHRWKWQDTARNGPTEVKLQ